MRLLDLFCGMGGWSIGFYREGFEPTGVDIVDVGYPYKLILQDVETLEGSRFQGFDVVVGSPPCRDFSQQIHASWRWKRPPDVQKGLRLVNALLRLVQEIKPRIWLMENVPALEDQLRRDRLKARGWHVEPVPCKNPTNHQIKQVTRRVVELVQHYAQKYSLTEQEATHFREVLSKTPPPKLADLIKNSEAE